MMGRFVKIEILNSNLEANSTAEVGRRKTGI